MNDEGWIGAVLAGARPQAVAALLRWFRDLDRAEEAFQEACLRALKTWPVNGPPRDAAAWLVMVGRNAGIDGVRARARERPLPPEEALSDLSDAEDGARRGDRRGRLPRRHPAAPLHLLPSEPRCRPADRAGAPDRLGRARPRIARAFLVSEAAMEQRITRAKRAVAAADVPFETPGAVERSERLAAVAAMVYLLFNEGYTTDVASHGARAPLCTEAIRLGRLLLRLFPPSPRSWASSRSCCSSTPARRPASTRAAGSCSSRRRTARSGTGR
jgi:RNA polymerase sigma-70 factor, ECF subfamily